MTLAEARRLLLLAMMRLSMETLGGGVGSKHLDADPHLVRSTLLDLMSR